MKKSLVIAAIAATALSVSACGANSDGGSGSGTTGKAGDKTIGVVTFSASDTSMNQILSSLKSKGSSLGYETEVVDANGSVDQANSAIQNLVQKKVAAILVTAFPTSSLGGGLAAAKAAGIPVVSQGGGLGDGVAYNLDLNIGDPLGDQVATDLADGGKLLELTYRAGAPCLAREQSLDKALEGNDGIDVTKQEVTVPGQVESARASTEAWLSANPAKDGEIRAIWACFDDPGLGAISALKSGKVDDVGVYSFNGSPDALKAIQDGYVDGEIWLDLAGSGEQIVTTIDTILADKDAWKPKTEDGAYELVTPDSFDAFVKDHPDAL